jgi:hypothetical protein
MISKDDEVDKLNYFEFYDEKGLTLSNITYYDFDEGVEEFLDRDLPLMNVFDQIGNQTISMPCSNSISEEISDAYFQNNMLSYEYVQNSKEKNWNGFINQGNRNINQSGFISNEEFENLFHYNNNFSFINDDLMYNEQISTKKRNFLVNANNKNFTELKPKNKQKKVKKRSQAYYRKIINKYQYLKQFGNSYSNHSKSTTKSSSNNSNNNKSTISNNKNHLFISGPEELLELLNNLNISADNPYYKRKKKKIIKKVKNKVKNTKKYKSEIYERTIYRKFREFLNMNKTKEEFNKVCDNDTKFWDLFFGNKKDCLPIEKLIIARLKKPKQSVLRFIFKRRDIKDFYQEFKNNFKFNKKTESINQNIAYNFYIKYLDELYDDSVEDLNFDDDNEIV